MWFRLCCLLPLLLHLPSRAAEIVGWKIPLSRYLEGGMRAEELVKLESPPEASPFFHPGDQLHQLSNVTEDGKSVAEWIVWNATSDRLVVKGGLPAIRRLRNKIEAESWSSHVRLAFEIHDFPANGSMPDEKAVPLYRQAFVVRSGKDVEYESRGESLMFSFNGEAVFEEIIGEDVSHSPVYLRGALDVETKGQGRLKISNSVVLPAGGSAWIAGDTDGRSGILVKLTAEPVLPDGSPWREKLLRQNGGKVEPFVLDGGLIENRRIGEGWFSSWPMSEGDFARLVGLGDQAPPPQVDPFAVQPEIGFVFSIYPEIPAPVSLSQWIDGTVRDVAVVLREMGITLTEGDFIGYDPEQELFFSYTKTEDTSERIGMLLASGCSLRWQPPIAITFEDSGRTRLVSGGGMKAALERMSADGTVTRSLEIEPSFGTTEEIVDVRMGIFDQRDPVAKGSFKTSVTLRNGAFSEIWRDVTKGGEAHVLRAKAEVLRK